MKSLPLVGHAHSFFTINQWHYMRKLFSTLHQYQAWLWSDTANTNATHSLLQLIGPAALSFDPQVFRSLHIISKGSKQEKKINLLSSNKGTASWQRWKKIGLYNNWYASRLHSFCSQSKPQEFYHRVHFQKIRYVHPTEIEDSTVDGLFLIFLPSFSSASATVSLCLAFMDLWTLHKDYIFQLLFSLIV